MLAFIIILQAVLPVALVLWITLLPAASAIGFTTQAAGIGLALLAIALVMVWIMPPWWFPYLVALHFLLSVAMPLIRSGFGFASAPPARWSGWLAVLVAIFLGILGGYFGSDALLVQPFREMS
jgi:hypothetical protein